VSISLTEALPELAEELRRLLTESCHQELADQVRGLQIVDRCRCGDSFCSTFYVQPPPVGSYGPTHYNVALDPEQGMLILDVVHGTIACVEVLYRDDVRRKLEQLVP
jgi:hypothetical protein